MRRSDGKLCFGEKRGIILEDCMAAIMNARNYLDHDVVRCSRRSNSLCESRGGGIGDGR